jgi:hypothetical protein
MISTKAMPPLGTGLVYAITNDRNGRRYVGATCGTSALDRFWSHKSALRHQRHCNAGLQADWDSFGEAAFSVTVLESGIRDRDLSKTEHRWIARLRGQEAGVYNHLRRLAQALGVEPAVLTGDES